MRTLSNANSAALASDFFVRGRLWTLRRIASLVAIVFGLAAAWRIDGVQLSAVFQRSTGEALWAPLVWFTPVEAPGEIAYLSTAATHSVDLE